MNRREWVQASGAAALGAVTAPYTRAFLRPEAKLDCVFQLSVITDEISQDFGHAVEVAAKEFGVGLVELRGLWNKNIVNLDAKEVAEVQSLLKKHDLKVTDIDSKRMVLHIRQPPLQIENKVQTPAPSTVPNSIRGASTTATAR